MQWGDWVLNPQNLTLTYMDNGYEYEIDLEEIHSSAAILDWIFQVVGKSYGFKATYDLLRAFDDILKPQQCYCSFGKELGIGNKKLVRKLVNQYVEVYEEQKSNLPTTDELKPEYQRSDFGKLMRGKYASRLSEETNVVVLDPDVAKIFPNQEAVNEALRSLLKIDELISNQKKHFGR
jgi:hypothetical protein